MGAGQDGLRFYVDESIMALAMTLPVLRRDTTACGYPRGSHGVEKGTEDLDWMPRIAARGWIVIGRDKRLRTRPGEKEMMQSTGLRVIRLGGGRDLSSWEYVGLLVRQWDSIENHIAEKDSGPWFLNVRPSGIRWWDI